MMQKDVALVSAYANERQALLVARLLNAEGWQVSYKVGRAALNGIDMFDPETLTLFLMSPDGQVSPYVKPWFERVRRDRTAVLDLTGSPGRYRDVAVFDFKDWRGERSHLWRSLKHWLEAPHARLDTRVWLKRA